MFEMFHRIHRNACIDLSAKVCWRFSSVYSDKGAFWHLNYNQGI